MIRPHWYSIGDIRRLAVVEGDCTKLWSAHTQHFQEIKTDMSMDDSEVQMATYNKLEAFPRERDENRSPSSGSSSGEAGDVPIGLSGRGAESTKRHRRMKGKGKRKWKPYSELTWDERRQLDDRETQRAYAKRERLTAEGHPIAPYNTTQFLMEDHHPETPDLSEKESPPKSTEESHFRSPNREDQPRPQQDHVPNNNGTADAQNCDIDALNAAIATITSVVPPADCAPSPAPACVEEEEIQDYIMEDFSHMYAGMHTEHLHSLSKNDLISECLRLERRVSNHVINK